MIWSNFGIKIRAPTPFINLVTYSACISKQIRVFWLDLHDLRSAMQDQDHLSIYERRINAIHYSEWSSLVKTIFFGVVNTDQWWSERVCNDITFQAQERQIH